MDIVHIATEMAPLVKVGGLGDVLQGLSNAQRAEGHKVEVLLPRYEDLQPQEGVTLIDCGEHFKGGRIYGSKKDPERFIAFCKAALSYLEKRGFPSIVHLHDWHAAAAAPLLHGKVPLIFTIHNYAYQGECKKVDLPHKKSFFKEGHYNLLQAGILFSNHVTTVSPSYAQELGIEKVTGVLNGIDYDYWNPTNDPHLPLHYSLQNLSNKKKVKEKVRARFGLAPSEAPLVCAISRLVEQKSPDLIEKAISHTLDNGGQFILLGSANDQKTTEHFETLKKIYAYTKQAHLELTFQEELSHLLYAGADLIVVPSRFEPCGLTQMIAMRYGTVPLVRATGGLKDTVFEEKNGFSFSSLKEEDLCHALDRAFAAWSRPKWAELVQAGMQEDHSWKRPAAEYEEIYEDLLERQNIS